MANTFKTFLNSDIANTRTLLHEAIPITGTIVSGTYGQGMFEAVYDYPYLSSSANNIFDITWGYSNNSEYSSSNNSQNAKKINIYNQHAQVLVGYDATGSIQDFDQDGNIVAGGTKIDSCVFVNFARLLVKDEIKKGSLRMSLFSSGTHGAAGAQTGRDGLKVLGDYGAATSYKVNSPAGEYGLLYTASLKILFLPVPLAAPISAASCLFILVWELLVNWRMLLESKYIIFRLTTQQNLILQFISVELIPKITTTVQTPLILRQAKLE